EPAYARLEHPMLARAVAAIREAGGAAWGDDVAPRALDEAPPPVEITENRHGKPAIFLRNSKLGEVPREVFALRTAVEVDLAANGLRTLPKEIGELRALESLDLGYNQLDALPDEIGALANLRKLFLHDNKFRGLPPSLQKLKKLEQLF